MFCPKCGAKIMDGAVFCQSCGAKLDNVPPVSPSPDGVPVSPTAHKSVSKKKILIVVLCLVLLAAIAAGAFYFLRGRKQSVLPYGVQWGMSEDDIAKVDKNIVGDKEDDDGFLWVVSVMLPGSLGITDETFSACTMYKIGDDGLSAVVIIVMDTGNMTDAEITESLTQYYSGVFATKPSINDKGVASWHNSESDLTFTYLVDSQWLIMFTPAGSGSSAA